jgi:hypothetical protein
MCRPNEDRPPFPCRTHADFVADALEQAEYEGPKVRAPYKRTGVKELSPLRFLAFFDLVWDLLPDMMHIIMGIWKAHIFPMLRGLRTPAFPKPRMKWTQAENERLLINHQKVLALLKKWALPEKVNSLSCCRH